MYTSPYAYPNPYQNINSHMMPSQQVIKVNGRNGAEAYQMSPNSSVLLLDESAPVVWLKTTDGAGYPSLTPYDITQHFEKPMPDLKALEDRITKIEEAMKNDQPNYTSNLERITNGTGKEHGADDQVLRKPTNDGHSNGK